MTEDFLCKDIEQFITLEKRKTVFQKWLSYSRGVFLPKFRGISQVILANAKSESQWPVACEWPSLGRHLKVVFQETINFLLPEWMMESCK